MARQPVPGVLGSFIHIDAAIDAIRTLRRAGHQGGQGPVSQRRRSAVPIL